MPPVPLRCHKLMSVTVGAAALARIFCLVNRRGRIHPIRGAIEEECLAGRLLTY